MYTLINPIEETITAANGFVISNDRQLLADLFRVIEEECAANNFMILSQDILLGRELGRESYLYDIWFTGGFNAAKAMADALFAAKVPHFKINTLSLKTVVKDREMMLSINMRTFARMFAIHEPQIAPLTVLCPGRFAKTEIRAVGPIVHLINLYQQMYNYEMAKKWPELLETEKELFAMFDGATKEGSTEPSTDDAEPDSFAFGDISFDGGRHENRGNNQKTNKDNVQKAIKIILQSLDQIGGLVVGAPLSRLQIVAEMGATDILNILKKQLSGRIEVNESGFVFDFRLRKATFKVDGADAFDLFNSPQYEMMNYDTYHQNKIAGPFVQLRFAAIQYYIIAIILRLPPARVLNQFRAIRAEVLRRTELNPAEVFTKDKVCGMSISEKISKKKMAENQPMFQVYYPAIALAKGGAADFSGQPAQPVEIVAADKEQLAIAHRITRDFRPDLTAILRTFHRSNQGHMWAAPNYAKDQSRYRAILPYLPKSPVIYLDIGSGDGRDFRILAMAMGARRAIASDVVDVRNLPQIPGEEFIEIKENQPLPLSLSSIAACSFLHSAHHAQDALFRLADIARVLADGAILIIKDHNIETDTDANLTSFEHFVYSVGEGTATISDAARYNEVEPMWYYSAQWLRAHICGLGFTELYFGEEMRRQKTRAGQWIEVPKETRVYMAVFSRNTRKTGAALYKGSFEHW